MEIIKPNGWGSICEINPDHRKFTNKKTNCKFKILNMHYILKYAENEKLLDLKM